MLIRSECLAAMREMPDACMDSIVTDPPYELGFMGKSWDNAGIAYSVEMWAEALRVLKPGGHLLAFGGTRTYHRMACAIEDAGFEIRDSIHWIYGSGFPKSHNISKAIDKANSSLKVIGKGKAGKTALGQSSGYNHTNNPHEFDLTEPNSPEATTWQGWGTALKPAHEPIVVARKPLIGTVAANVLKHGTGAINVDGCRVGTDIVQTNRYIAKGDMTSFHGSQAGNEYVSNNHEGRWPANLIFSHNEDCEQVGTTEETLTINKLEQWSGFGEKLRPDYESSSSTVNVAVWKCTPSCAVAELDNQSGERKAGGKVRGSEPSRTGDNGIYGEWGRVENKPFKDTGGASRYFTNTDWHPIDDEPPFQYIAKASKKERNAGLEGLPKKAASSMSGRRDAGNMSDSKIDNDVTGRFVTQKQNTHPTVKPVALMRWLVRLVTPPGGRVFDPFLGSGTTAVAAILEGFEWYGCEMTEDYWPIIKARVAWAEEQSKDS